MAQSSSSFIKVFLPGLVIGLIVGALAGAILPDLLSGPAIKAPSANGIAHANGARDRDFDERASPDIIIPENTPANENGETGLADEDDDSSGG